MSGNFGGNSIPTEPVDAFALYQGRETKYKDWLCTKVITARGTSDFTYKGVTVLSSTVASGVWVDLIMDPMYINEVDAGFFTLFCYSCSCENPVTSPVPTTSGDTGNYQNYNQMNKPIIIGGGGLNS
jgi:hypothetical protein